MNLSLCSILEILLKLIWFFFTEMCTKWFVKMCAKFWENILTYFLTSRKIDTIRAKVYISKPNLSPNPCPDPCIKMPRNDEKFICTPQFLQETTMFYVQFWRYFIKNYLNFFYLMPKKLVNMCEKLRKYIGRFLIYGLRVKWTRPGRKYL